MKILITIYFNINLFLSGYKYCQNNSFADDIGDRVVAILYALFYAVFGVAYLAGKGLVMLAIQLLSPLQIGFWWTYFFTNEYRNMTEEQLYNGNLWLQQNRDNRLIWKMSAICIRKLNARHSYTFKKKGKRAK